MNVPTFQRSIWIVSRAAFVTALGYMLITIASDGLSDRKVSAESFLSILAYVIVGAGLISVSRYTA